VLQCVVVCCSVLQCVAVCCSVLQCVAVFCSVLQCGETSADGIAAEDETTAARISQKSVLQSYRMVSWLVRWLCSDLLIEWWDDFAVTYTILLLHYNYRTILYNVTIALTFEYVFTSWSGIGSGVWGGGCEGGEICGEVCGRGGGGWGVWGAVEAGY